MEKVTLLVKMSSDKESENKQTWIRLEAREFLVVGRLAEGSFRSTNMSWQFKVML